MSCLTCFEFIIYYFFRLFVIGFILTNHCSTDEGEVDVGIAVTLCSCVVYHTVYIERDCTCSAIPYLLLSIGDDCD